MTQAVMSRLMGGPSTSTSTAEATSSQAPPSALPNPVLKFLYSREEPKVVNMKVGQQKEPHRNVDVRKMHQAGGYDISLYEQRNWAEIQYHLGQSNPA
jgi:hypothetical protein